MGHRASYVIVRGGVPRFYRSQFGALTVGRDIVAGPAARPPTPVTAADASGLNPPDGG